MHRANKEKRERTRNEKKKSEKKVVIEICDV